jgi:hypothetical protein
VGIGPLQIPKFGNVWIPNKPESVGAIINRPAGTGYDNMEPMRNRNLVTDARCAPLQTQKFENFRRTKNLPL